MSEPTYVVYDLFGQEYLSDIQDGEPIMHTSINEALVFKHKRSAIKYYYDYLAHEVCTIVEIYGKDNNL